MLEDKGNNPLDLDQLDDGYAATECDADNDTDELPDGKYQMIVEKAEVQSSQKGNPMLVWRFRILGPRYAGRKHWHRNMIVTKENLRWLKHDLTVAGLELGKLSDLPNRQGDLSGVTLEVQLKTKGERQNTFINKRIRRPEGTAEATGGATPPDDFVF